MIFQHPDYLWTIMAAGAAIFLGYLILLWRKVRILKHFGGRKLLNRRGSHVAHPWREVVRALAVVLVFILLSAAYWAGPQIKEVREIPIYERAEICFAIDASRSALARDIGSLGNMSRFNFAKEIVKAAKKIVDPEDAPCLIFFAGSAITTVAVGTYFGYIDIGWEYILSDLRYADEYFVEYEIPQGSSFVPMIMKALSAFSDSSTRKILMVISDGEPERGADISVEQRRTDELAAVNQAKKAVAEFRKGRELAIEFMGIGDITGASPIPKKIARDGSVLNYYTYSSGSKKGEKVLTRPDPAFLLSAAQSLGGKYRHVRSLDEAKVELSAIFAREKKIVSWEKKEEMTEAWSYFLLTGLVLLFAVPFLKSP